jgi:hypothetical protein
MVHSPESTVFGDGHHQADVGFASGGTIHLGSLASIANRFGSLSLSPEGNDSCVIFTGVVRTRSPSLHAILEESANEDDWTSSEWGGGGAPSSPSIKGVTW